MAITQGQGPDLDPIQDPILDLAHTQEALDLARMASEDLDHMARDLDLGHMEVVIIIEEEDTAGIDTDMAIWDMACMG